MQAENQRGPLRDEAAWWRRGGNGKGKPLPVRHHFAHDHVRSRLYETLVSLGCNESSSVLEVGCGGGEDAVFVRKATENIVGVDVSPMALPSFVGQGFAGVRAEARWLPFPADTFDFVVASGLLHHLVGQGSLQPYLAEFARVTKPGGGVVALEPNVLNPSGLMMNIGNTLKPGISGLVPHERALSPWYLRKVLGGAGLEEVRCFSASFVWNRFPLAVSRFIARREDGLRTTPPFRYFGWFLIVHGRKAA